MKTVLELKHYLIWRFTT